MLGQETDRKSPQLLNIKELAQQFLVQPELANLLWWEGSKEAHTLLAARQKRGGYLCQRNIRKSGEEVSRTEIILQMIQSGKAAILGVW